MSRFHVPVLMQEVLEGLDPQPGETVLDATEGTGGHSRELFRRVLPGGRLVGLDRDPSMVAIARERLLQEFPGHEAQMSFHAIPYEQAPSVVESADVVLLDLGFNSLQIDDGARGFSFLQDAPLDMRYNPEAKDQTAADIVNTAPEEKLARMLWDYSDERYGRQIARRILADRRTAPITTTAQLRELVADVYPAKERFGRLHPATRTFQALRIAVNDELGHVERGLEACVGLLNPGGRMAVIAFHSTEERLTKKLFDRLASPRPTPENLYSATSSEGLDFEIDSRRAISCSEEEADANPRARSAKLRVIRRKGGRNDDR